MLQDVRTRKKKFKKNNQSKWKRNQEVAKKKKQMVTQKIEEVAQKKTNKQENEPKHVERIIISKLGSLMH
jgi:hypothetical protein